MATFHIDRLANAGVAITINGKPYTARQLTMRTQGRLQAIIRNIEPDPYKEAAELTKGMPESVVKEIMKDARKAALTYPTPVTSPDGIAKVIGCEEGQKAILKASLNLSDDEVEQVMDTINYAEFMRLAAIAISGEDPTDEGEDDPKAVIPMNPEPE